MEFNFEKLEVWCKARILVKNIYILIKDFPIDERFALADQIRRASVSVPSNIAEGCARTSPKEKVHFLEIAYGSLMEAYNQLLLACDLEYIDTIRVQKLKPEFEEIAKMMSGMRRNLLDRKQS
ncbi:MAG: four helix bundle protein [Bacteroidaceae bacterium]|nr:four helix bundle protein [Bacteroidaceae bacterium]